MKIILYSALAAILTIVGLAACGSASSSPGSQAAAQSPTAQSQTARHQAPTHTAPQLGGSCVYKGGYYGGAQAGHWTKIAGKPFCMPNGAKQENPTPKGGGGGGQGSAGGVNGNCQLDLTGYNNGALTPLYRVAKSTEPQNVYGGAVYRVVITNNTQNPITVNNISTAMFDSKGTEKESEDLSGITSSDQGGNTIAPGQTLTWTSATFSSGKPPFLLNQFTRGDATTGISFFSTWDLGTTCQVEQVNYG